MRDDDEQNIAELVAWELEGAYHSLPSERKRAYDDMAEEVGSRILTDPLWHEGCVPACEHELPSCDKRMLGFALEEGYEKACADVLERLERLSALFGDPRAERERAIVARFVAGVVRLKARGPE